MSSATFARGDGGFGGPSDGAPEPHQIPDRKSDDEFFADTEPNQALIYRLSGDRNPLHSIQKLQKLQDLMLNITWSLYIWYCM